MHRAVLAVVVLCFGVPLPGAAQVQGTVKPAGKEPTLTIGGFIQAQADVGDQGDTRFTNDNDRFYLRRARLNATGRFLEEFDFRLEVDLAGSLSNTSALRAQMTDGFINWNRYPPPTSASGSSRRRSASSSSTATRASHPRAHAWSTTA